MTEGAQLCQCLICLDQFVLLFDLLPKTSYSLQLPKNPKLFIYSKVGNMIKIYRYLDSFITWSDIYNMITLKNDIESFNHRQSTSGKNSCHHQAEHCYTWHLSRGARIRVTRADNWSGWSRRSRRRGNQRAGPVELRWWMWWENISNL